MSFARSANAYHIQTHNLIRTPIVKACCLISYRSQGSGASAGSLYIENIVGTGGQAFHKLLLAQKDKG